MELVNQGLDALSRHRRNHDSTGANPEQLQVLWWEFPREHWDALREGVEGRHIIAHTRERIGADDESEEVPVITGT